MSNVIRPSAWNQNKEYFTLIEILRHPNLSSIYTLMYKQQPVILFILRFDKDEGAEFMFAYDKDTGMAHMEIGYCLSEPDSDLLSITPDTAIDKLYPGAADIKYTNTWVR